MFSQDLNRPLGLRHDRLLLLLLLLMMMMMMTTVH
jgi:hypothetical protein